MGIAEILQQLTSSNQHYAQIVHHPAKFGTSAKAEDAWGPVWDDVVPVIKRCFEFGESCHFQDDLLLYRRGSTGHFVEKYHTWSFVPLFDADQKPLGLFNPTTETTAAVLARRRQETLRDVSEQVSLARTTGEFYEGVRNVMEKNAKDIPFMAFYSTSPGDKSTIDLHLQSSVGVPDDHPSCPAKMSVSLRATRPSLAPHLSSPTPSSVSISSVTSGRTLHSDLQTAWPIVPALAARQCVVMDDCSKLVEGFPLRQWDHLPEAAIVLPIAPDRSSSVPDAVMILGLNLQCPLDPAYDDWIHILRAHLTSALATVQGIELAEQRRLEKERMAKAQTAWFQGAAHDLRSPLTLVDGPLDDVLQTNLTGFQRQSLVLAQRNVARIQRLVNALLDFSRIEAGRLTGHFFALDLGAFVSEIAHLFSPAVARRGIEYNVHIQPDGPSVWFDPTLMETAITNLISNAVKYTQKGRIGVAVAYTSTHAVITVSDTGCGIPQAEVDDVTERFNRATTALSAGVEGTGIGLALTKELIKIHDGELLLSSRTELEAKREQAGMAGSTFTVRIPLVDRLNAVENGTTTTDRGLGTYGRQMAREAMENGQSDLSPITDSMDGADRNEGFLFEPSDTLLLVDDNEDIRAYIRRIFAPHCRVVEATDGEEAVRLAQTLVPKPNLILSDVMMPRMSGTELLIAIREHPTTKRIPMVLLSAATDEELRLSALTNGAEDFILKPFKPKELLARVHLHMQLGKKRADLEDMFALREQEVQVLTDYCPSGIVRADENGNILYANATWKQYVGMPPDGDVNSWTDYLEGPTLQRIQSMWEEMIAGTTSELQVTWTWTNGITVTGTFVRLGTADREGRRGIVGCLQDITYQEERLHEAERRRIEAEEAKRQQELLVDMTSHEIRTPVSAILQCSSLVKENMVALRKELVEAGETGYVIPAETLEEFDRDLEALESETLSILSWICADQQASTNVDWFRNASQAMCSR
jgi:signal transduction histidine kinase